MRRDIRLERVNVMLSAETLDWLDETVASIRKETRAKLSRSALIRGMIQGLARGGLSIRGCTSDEEISAAVAEFLRRSHSRRAR